MGMLTPRLCLWLWGWVGVLGLGSKVVAGGTLSTPRSPFPDPSLSYYYVYTSHSDLLGLHNVTTQIKVRGGYCNIF